MDALDLEVRPALVGDTTRIVELSRQLGYTISSEHVRAILNEISTSANEQPFVAETPDGRVVGWIEVSSVRRLESEPFAEIGGLVVDEAFRGRDVGTRLLTEAENWARARALTSLRVRVRTTRKEAFGFYEGHGFENVKTQRVLSKPLE